MFAKGLPQAPSKLPAQCSWRSPNPARLQNHIGFTTTMITMMMSSTVGTSLIRR